MPAKVTPGFAGSRAGISVGDKLIGIGFEGEKTEEITSPADVQMYLETAGVDGNLTYFYQKPPYSFSDNYYFADLRHIDSIPRWTPSIIFSIDRRFDLAGRRHICAVQARQPVAVRPCILPRYAWPRLSFTRIKAIGIGKDFDLAVDLLDNIALAFFVPLFLHFCIRYPVRSAVFSDPPWKTYILYLPAAVLSLILIFVSLVPQFSPESALTETIARLSDRFNIFGLLYQRKPLSFRNRCLGGRERPCLAIFQESPGIGSTAAEMDDVGNDRSCYTDHTHAIDRTARHSDP